MTRLSVNIDHVATLRQARRAPYPDLLEAAAMAQASGADGITVHLRYDRRHVQDADVRALRESVKGKLNLEMSIEAEMLAVAIETLPDQATLVPERPEEVTTEGGLDLLKKATDVREAARVLRDSGISVSLFVDPDPEQVRAAAKLLDVVDGFELNTDRYSKCSLDPTANAEATKELARITECARLGAQAGLAVYAGHGLTAENVGSISAVPEIEELNIGHSLVARAVFVGLGEAIREMLESMRRAEPS